jgi:hypothetical protein
MQPRATKMYELQEFCARLRKLIHAWIAVEYLLPCVSRSHPRAADVLIRFSTAVDEANVCSKYICSALEAELILLVVIVMKV